jgi:hypothetical protein
METIMFNPNYDFLPTNQNCLPEFCDVRLIKSEYHGRAQWYASVVPPEWGRSRLGYVQDVVVNLPREVKVFEGEEWCVKLRCEQPARHVLFADALFKRANPEGVPAWLWAGMQLVIADRPCNAGTHLKRTGIVKDVKAVDLPGVGKWLDLTFEKLERNVLKLESGTMPREADDIIRLTKLREVADHVWHAEMGDCQVMICW